MADALRQLRHDLHRSQTSMTDEPAVPQRNLALKTTFALFVFTTTAVVVGHLCGSDFLPGRRGLDAEEDDDPLFQKL